jgi:Ni/Co efflux regulator RcnB
MMSEGELVVPANVVRYHGLGTYENMRQEALAGLEMMEDAGQIEYVGDEKTSKTNDGGLLKAQTGVTPLGTAPTAASAQFAGLAASDASKFSYTPLRLNQGIPMYDAQGNIIGYQPNTQPTPTRTTGLGAIFTGDPTSVVAPNVGDYQESVKEDFTKPPEGTGGTTTSAGVGGDTGGGGGFAPATPNLTPQQQMQRFDANVEDLVDRIPTAPTAFQQSDFDSYVNVRQPMSEREGIMGKVGGAVDTAAGFILPFTGYQDKKIRESAADKLKNFAFGSKSEYDTLVKTVNLPSLGDTEDDPKLVQKLNDAKKIQFDDDTAKKANEFAAKRDAALAQAKEEMSAPVIFKDKTRVDKFLEGPQKTKEEIAAMKPGSEEAATAEYNRQLEKQRDKEMDRLMNPVFAAEKMASELPGSDTSMMSGSEREEAQRRREDAERRAAEFDAFREREETRRAEDSAGVDRGDFGGTPTASDDKIVCTEMYRQTQLVDWQKAMKVWDIYQRRHLTPEHQVGYHWLFRPYVTGMQSSNILTRLGAFMARKRTQHLKHILTKGKAKDDLFGNVFCKLIHPTVYIAGKIKTFLTKI